MEQTLVSIFDELDSNDNTIVSTGLDRLDQLLADICLPSLMDHPATQSSLQVGKISPGRFKKSNKNISILVNDPAYIEILSLQDSFQYNTATRLMACLSRLTRNLDESMHII